MSETLNIVDLIENNPVTKLSKAYNGRLLSKIKETFTDPEQQMFVASFYCSLNYNKRTDFIIDLDNVWKWLGFSQKVNAKMLLEKNFEIDVDYKSSLLLQQKRSNYMKGGQNKEIIMMNIETFKRFCMKAGTKKAHEMHEYYIKLEDTLHDVIREESDELKLQLENKNNELIKFTEQSELDKTKLRERTILEQFPPNSQCVYYGVIDNKGNNGENLIKFGNSNNLRSRVLQHKDTYDNFRLINAFKVSNKFEIESAIKTHAIFSPRICTLAIRGKNYVELLNIDGLTNHAIGNMIHDIIKSHECTPENYKRIIEDNAQLRKQIYDRGQSDNSNRVTILTIENERLTRDNTFLIKRNKKLEETSLSWKSIISNQQMDIAPTENNIIHNSIIESTIPELPIPIVEQSTEIIHIFKRPTKHRDGKYHIDGKIYTIFFGTRQEVWDETAFKTSGGLLKSDLIINKHGLIVSLLKSITGRTDKRLEGATRARAQGRTQSNEPIPSK
jgi:hypothetical protein